jgi:hypothetical protein
LARSVTADGAALSRSLGAQRRASEGAAAAGFGFGPAGASGPASAAAARPLQATASIPKSAAFVKIEGFDTRDSSPAGSAPPSPQQPRVLSSLLSRQLSTDRLPSLGASLANTPSVPSALGAAVPAPGLEDLAARLESAVRVAPVPRPPTPLLRPRTAIPDDLLQQLQVRVSAYATVSSHSFVTSHIFCLAVGRRCAAMPVGCPSPRSPPTRSPSPPLSSFLSPPCSPAPQREHSVFAEPVCVRAFGIARAAHDGRCRASGEPALLHCVEVARILAGMGADEGTVSGAPRLSCFSSPRSVPARQLHACGAAVAQPPQRPWEWQ